MLEGIKDYINPPITDHRIFFFHIAKCGGTSIANAIVRCYKPWRPKNALSIVTLNENAARYAERNTIGDGNLVRRDLLNYMMSLPEVKCIAGHFFYSNTAHDTYGDRWHFITVLRNPIDRFLSHYRYNHLKGKIQVPIEEFVETKLGASFGRAFVDEVTEDVEKDAIGIEKLTEIAIERYRRFTLVGTIDDIPAFTRRFEEIFSHRLTIKHLNQTPKSPKTSLSKIPDHVRKKIAQLCEPDAYLYRKIIDVK